MKQLSLDTKIKYQSGHLKESTKSLSVIEKHDTYEFSE